MQGFFKIAVSDQSSHAPVEKQILSLEAFEKMLDITCQVVTNVAFARAHLEAGELR